MRIRRVYLIALISVMALLVAGIATTYAASQGQTGTSNAQEKPGAFLGVNVAESDEGVIVRGVRPGSPAEVAGIQVDDILRSFDGTEVESVEQLRELIQGKAAGDVVTVAVLRGEESLELQVTLGEAEVTPPQVIEVRPGDRNFGFSTGGYQLGVEYRALTPEIAETEGLSVTEGALVEAVVPGSPAEDAGLQVGDIITAVDGDAVDIEHTLSDRLYAYEAQDRVTFSVQRGEESLEISAVLADEHSDRQAGRGFFAGPRTFTIPFNGEFGFGEGPSGRTFEFQPINPNFDFPNAPGVVIPAVPFEGEGSIQVFGRGILSCTTADGQSFQVILPNFDLGEGTEVQVPDFLSDLGIECEFSTPAPQFVPDDAPPGEPQGSAPAVPSTSSGL